MIINRRNNMRKIAWLMMLWLGFSAFVFADGGVCSEDKPNAMVSAKQPQFTVELKSNPTTGYSWFLSTYDPSLIAPVKHQFVAPDTKLVGAAGYQRWVFRVKPAAFVVPHQFTIKFIYARPWDTKETAREVTFQVMTQ
jgi:inhibitor of cysteine peptidase